MCCTVNEIGLDQKMTSFVPSLFCGSILQLNQITTSSETIKRNYHSRFLVSYHCKCGREDPLITRFPNVRRTCYELTKWGQYFLILQYNFHLFVILQNHFQIFYGIGTVADSVFERKLPAPTLKVGAFQESHNYLVLMVTSWRSQLAL